uniref:Uncharacterized protein n=2 Tax=Gloeothece TaxID=28070 RepID=E0UJ36_GLOV7|nr:hypothetical protein Cyan7822_3805 [Gloeothece verrucosa PCC 7822]
MINSFSLHWLDNLFTLFNLREAERNFQKPELTHVPKNQLTHQPREIQSQVAAHSSKLKAQTFLDKITVGVFFHHRDVRVALEDLTNAGFPLNSLTLMARNIERHNWLSQLNIFSHFEPEIFSFSRECEQFFQKFFCRGKYILVVEGTEEMVDFAAKVFARRRDHSKVWYLVKN